MGVRCLESFMQKTVPNGVKQVDIREEINKYKEQYEKEPSLIFHLRPLHTQTRGTNYHEVLLGRCYNEFNDKAIKLFTSIKDLGVNLIFFTEGPPRDDIKRTTILECRTKRYYYDLNILRNIDEGIDFSQLNPGLKINTLEPLYTSFITIATQFGEVNVATLNDCDLELSNLATKVNALAVIGSNTNFLIYEGDWRYWSSKDIDLTNLTIKEYNRKALKDFFRTLKQSNVIFRLYEDFSKVADLVKTARSTQPDISENCLLYFVKKIFSPKDIRTGCDYIRTSLKSYNYRKQINTDG